VTGPRQGQSGFTLLEVLVALAILGLAIVASIQGFAQGLRLLKLSGDHQRAVLIADEKARELVTLEEGRQDGTEGEFRWERTVSPVPMPELTTAAGTEPRWRQWQIAVRVVWDERRFVEVATLRTLPAQQDAITTLVPVGGTPGPGPTPGGPTAPTGRARTSPTPPPWGRGSR
jgi:general secretion pathway protein I